MRHLLYSLLAAVAALWALSGCINDSFTTSPNDVLAFSVDTLSFDTVITRQGTATKQFVVYNRHKKQVRISSISVSAGDQGKFFINVDGVKGTEFHDVEIRGEDSIFVFVEGLVDGEMPSNGDPLPLEGAINFVTNGVAQQVVLTAWGQDVETIVGDTVWTDLHLTAQRPYVIYDTLVMAPGTHLTIDPGAQLLFHNGAVLRVYGRMTAVGTPQQNIILRGDRLDHVVGKINFDIMSGQWGGVVIGYGSYDNEMAYVQMRGSELGMHVSSEDPTRRTLHMLNCMLHNSSSGILTCWNANIFAEGTEFSDAAAGVVTFIGGDVRLVNCTLANYYLFSAISDPIVNVWIEDSEQSVMPLHCYLDNCVIYGNCDGINFGNLDDSQIFLRNCLMKESGTDDANFLNMVWKGDPKFYTVREEYVFDYRLRNGSDAIAHADRSLCPESARYDRYGQDRFAREALDIGAYVWVPADE